LARRSTRRARSSNGATRVASRRTRVPSSGRSRLGRSFVLIACSQRSVTPRRSAEIASATSAYRGATQKARFPARIVAAVAIAIAAMTAPPLRASAALVCRDTHHPVASASPHPAHKAAAHTHVATGTALSADGHSSGAASKLGLLRSSTMIPSPPTKNASLQGRVQGTNNAAGAAAC
jgi:hypothetical protein